MALLESLWVKITFSTCSVTLLSHLLNNQGSTLKGVRESETPKLLCRFPCFLSHLLIAGCDIGVQISVRPYVRSSVRSFVRSFVRPSTFTSKFSFLDIRDSCESETLHSNCP